MAFPDGYTAMMLNILPIWSNSLKVLKALAQKYLSSFTELFGLNVLPFTGQYTLWQLYVILHSELEVRINCYVPAGRGTIR